MSSCHLLLFLLFSELIVYYCLLLLFTHQFLLCVSLWEHHLVDREHWFLPRTVYHDQSLAAGETGCVDCCCAGTLPPVSWLMFQVLGGGDWWAGAGGAVLSLLISLRHDQSLTWAFNLWDSWFVHSENRKELMKENDETFKCWWIKKVELFRQTIFFISDKFE